MANTEKRFKQYISPQLNGCWIWIGSLNTNGYGQFSIDGRPRLAHRVSWKLKYGSYPASCLCHKCDTPSCVNPDHLFVGTRKDNILDSIAKGRFFTNHIAFTPNNPARLFQIAKTVCAKGHPHDQKNTYLYRGNRICKTCIQKKAWRHKTGRRG